MTDHLAQRIAEPNTILRGLVGSRLHGVVHEGGDDRDEMGICIEPPECVIGLQPFEQWEWRTQGVGSGRRSGPGDLDLVVYSLRKFVRLAVAGNPSILALAFVPREHLTVSTALGFEVQHNAGMFWSKQAGHRFLGYLTSQRGKLEGNRPGHTNRPELIERYGFDTKYAFHMIRLGIQGCEFLTTGAISYPIPEPDRTWLTQLRHGEHTVTEALERADELTAALEALLNDPEIPERCDMSAVNNWLISMYERHWDTLS